MERVNIHSDLEAVDQAFLGAVAAITGLSRIHVLDIYWGADRDTGMYRDEVSAPDADVYVEWMRARGRFGLAIQLYGPKPTVTALSEGQIIAQLAARLSRSFVTSDCGANPWSWFRIDPDGAVWRVFTATDDEDGERFDLAHDLEPDDPYLQPLLISPAGTPWPEKPADAPERIPAELRRICHDANGAGKLCGVFWGACPYVALRLGG